MDIFSVFSKARKIPVLFRCSECNYEFEFSLREVRLMERKNAHDPVCPPKEECHICHSGFMIPVNYTDKHGKLYLFHKIKPEIEPPDPDTFFERFHGLNSD